MTTCKKMLSMLCMVAILSFSLVFVPTTKAQKMEQITISMEADANPAVAIGIGFLALICVVLAWYGISVVTDSTDAQSCAAFVEGKIQEFKESQNIKIASIAMFSVMHLNLIKQWVSEWIATQENAYVASGSSSLASITMASDNTSFKYGSNLTPGVLFEGVVPSIDATMVQKLEIIESYPDSTSEGYIFYHGSNFYCISPLSENLRYSFHFNGSFSAAVNSGNAHYQYHGYRYAIYDSYGAAFKFSEILRAAGIPLVESSLTPGEFIDQCILGNAANYPSISAPANKRITIPAAQDVFNGTGSLESYGIDNPDYIDFGSALSKLQDMYGNPALTWEDVITGVNTGAISASDVLTATDAIPYVNTDVATGEIATSDTAAENVKPVALPNDLALPTTGEIINAKPYLPRYSGDETTNKFKLRLFDFFPFCLPWDIYQILSSFDSDPVAPVIELPLGKFFKNVPGVDEDTTEYVAKLDLGDKNFYKWFEILRTLECVGIIVGLVLVSRKLIHGGD